MRTRILWATAGFLLFACNLAIAAPAVSPECQTAFDALAPAGAEGKTAFKVLSQAAKKTDRVLQEQGRVMKDLRGGGTPDVVSAQEARLNRIMQELERAYAAEQAAQNRLSQALKTFDQRLSEVEARCRGDR